jgi:hypothetical protein
MEGRVKMTLTEKLKKAHELLKDIEDNHSNELASGADRELLGEAINCVHDILIDNS